MDNVLLTYCRTGLTYTGDVDGEAFNGESFAEMMLRVHRRLLEKPTAGVTMHWTGRAGTLPSQLEPALLQLLREDPDEYIRSNSVAHRVVNLRAARNAKAATQHALPRGGLRAGHDTLADAFGEDVYLRLRTDKVEHPADGRWVPLSEFITWLGGCVVRQVHGKDSGRSWAIVPLQALLQTDTVLFYIPREWNTYGSWITKAQLMELYKKFTEDKSQCLSEIK
jgi:hypothetical protein